MPSDGNMNLRCALRATRLTGKGRYFMQLSARRLTISCLIFAFVATWLGAVQPARAGDGGADLGSLQTFITGTLCPAVGINPCPQLPTITQAVLEIAGLSNTPPEIARANNNIAMGLHADAGNPSRPPAYR